MGYLNPSLDHLRGYQELASAYVLDALGLQWTEGEWPPRLRSERSGASKNPKNRWLDSV